MFNHCADGCQSGWPANGGLERLPHPSGHHPGPLPAHAGRRARALVSPARSRRSDLSAAMARLCPSPGQPQLEPREGPRLCAGVHPLAEATPLRCAAARMPPWPLPSRWRCVHLRCGGHEAAVSPREPKERQGASSSFRARPSWPSRRTRTAVSASPTATSAGRSHPETTRACTRAARHSPRARAREDTASPRPKDNFRASTRRPVHE